MAKRKKRLEKGIDSIQKQIELHEEKKKVARELGQEELIGYYTNEILALEKRKINREEKLDKKKK